MNERIFSLVVPMPMGINTSKAIAARSEVMLFFITIWLLWQRYIQGRVTYVVLAKKAQKCLCGQSKPYQ
jgi:hypothetical protein